jgi:hypothetical protein
VKRDVKQDAKEDAKPGFGVQAGLSEPAIVAPT